MSLHQVRLNFILRLEAITPTYTRTLDRGFENVDRLRQDLEGNTTGRARDFVIVRLRGLPEGPDTPSHYALRCGHHDYELRIAYPTAIGTENDIHEAIDTDRHQILEALRHASTFTGTPANGSADVGLKKRIYEGDQLNDEGPVWVQAYAFDCIVWETV